MPLDPAQEARLAALTPDERRRLRALLDAATPARLDGFGLLAEALRALGVRGVCGIPGTPSDGLFAAPARRGLRVLGVRHQTTAVLMAAAANYLTGRLDYVVAVSAGPAVTNTLTGILVARDNGWPVVVLGGRRATEDEGAGYFQELDAVPVMAPVTKWAATVRRTADLGAMLREAVGVACSGVPGPVYLDLPEDVLFGRAAPAPLDPPAVRPCAPAPDDAVEATAALLRTAERPLLLLGDGARWDVDRDALRALIEHEALPFATTSLARGLLPDDHPLCLNVARQAAQPAADLIVMAGAWFDYRFQRGAGVHPEARVVHVEPDPARRGRNVNLTLGVDGASGDFLNRLAAACRRRPPAERPAWRAALEALRDAARRDADAWARAVDHPMLPQQLYRALRDELPDDAVVVVEGSFHMASGQAGLEINAPLAWLDAGWNGCMGAGLPLALGARLAYPDRPVVAVVGDTGAGLSGMELETAVRHGLPVVLVVANNGGINGRARQERMMGADYPEDVFAYGTALRYDRMAEGLGARGAWVPDADVLRPALAAAFAHPGPSCVNVLLHPRSPAPRFW